MKDNYFLVRAIKYGSITIDDLLKHSYINKEVAIDGYLTTPLITAVCKNDEEMVKKLLKLKANPNLCVNRKSPLHFAENPSIVRMLIKAGADIEYKDGQGYTPLHLMIRNRSYKCAKILLKHGANIHTFNTAGSHPLTSSLLIWANPDSIVVDLLKPLINVKDQNGKWPLLIAARNGHWKIVKKMLDYGADINFRNNKGTTVLHEAVSDGNLRMIRYLIKRGADPNILDIRGEAPWMRLYLNDEKIEKEVKKVFKGKNGSYALIVD
jgi:ankyrin repeat protein